MLLVIDIGTSTFKAALLGYDGSCGGMASRALPMVSSGGRHETDSALWLRAFERTMAELGAGLGAVEALVVSGNGPTVVPVTGEPTLCGGELRLEADSARLWLDRRAEEEARKVSAIMGGYVDAGFFLPKILALKNRERGLYGRTRYFLGTPEFLVYALTGQARTVFPSEGFDRWFWNDAVLTAAELDREKLPAFVSPGDYMGDVLPEVAARFGFGRGVQVFAGGPDFFVSILGTGTVRPGQACDRAGTSEGVNLCTQVRITDQRLMSYGHPVKPFWNLSGIISTSGKAIDWGRELLGIAEAPYEAFYEPASRAAPGAGGVIFLPYLAGERAPIWDPNARGVFMGLSLDTGRGELARAVAEGVCFAMRDVIAVMEELGAPLEELRVAGGPGESDFLNQLKADVTGRPVAVPSGTVPAELMGLAVLGAAAMGKYGSTTEAAGAMVRTGRVFTPDREKTRLYDGIFEEYRELYRILKGRFAKNP
ncbi:xylulokinase [Spirochaetia bacterium]|nr:xylulokinase [Spirochaetia bacterium]